MSHWLPIQFSFDSQLKIVKAEWKKKTITLDLRLYLIRKSKKYKDTIVLEAISDIVPQEERKVSFSFKTVVFEEVYSQVFGFIQQYRNDQLIKMETCKGFGN